MAILNNGTSTINEQPKIAGNTEVAGATGVHAASAAPAAKRLRQRNAKSKLAEQASEPARRKTKAKANFHDQASDKPKADVAKSTKAELVLKKLRLARGATIEMLMEVTGWQAHSVRGFLS